MGDVIDMPKPNIGNGAREAMMRLFKDNEAPATIADRLLLELWAEGFMVVPLDKIEKLEADNEELIRGMTEMALRFTTAMDAAMPAQS